MTLQYLGCVLEALAALPNDLPGDGEPSSLYR